MKLSRYLMVVASLLFAFNVFAADSAPMMMMKKMTASALQQLEANKAKLKTNPQIVGKIVSGLVRQYVALNTVSRVVVGPVHWRKATAQQKQQFKKQFTFYVVRMYQSALQSYRGEKVKFYPIRGNANRRSVVVRTVVMRKSGQKIPVSYQLIHEAGKWKIYDMNVEGVSMLRSYHSQFSAVLANKGMAGLLVEMKSRSKHRG